MTKFKKGDLIRCRSTHDKGLILGSHLPNGSVKVLWLTGNYEGDWTWGSPDYLVKMEVRGA